MGAKARVLPGFLDRVIEDEAPPGTTVVDLMSGTGAVAVHCAAGRRVFANDAQEYAAVVARSLIEHDPARKGAFLASLSFARDLAASYRENLRMLERLYEPALDSEEQLLAGGERGAEDARWCRRYRAFLRDPHGLYPQVAGAASRSTPYRLASGLLREETIGRYRAGQARRPACLATAYYGNVYFGLRQALVIDSLRAAIDDLEPRGAHAGAKRDHYLSALLHAASVSTSGTSHFAQPRHLDKDSELRAMAARRRQDVLASFHDFAAEIAARVAATPLRAGNRATARDYRRLIVEGNGAGPRFTFPVAPDLVYLDPPYTQDHYSRFYHVLEVLARYDYPPLERDGAGRVLRGRYPELAERFQSGFCRPATVEGEFRLVARAAAGAGAKLVVSYAAPTGLLLKEYARRRHGGDPVRRLERLLGESYAEVRTRRRSLIHSGQGEAGRAVEELLVVCRAPR